MAFLAVSREFGTCSHRLGRSMLSLLFRRRGVARDGEIVKPPCRHHPRADIRPDPLISDRRLGRLIAERRFRWEFAHARGMLDRGRVPLPVGRAGFKPLRLPLLTAP